MPRVSVVVSHYDRPALLAGALASIAAQTDRDFEVIVVNDHGVNSAALVAEFAAGVRRGPGAFDVRYDYRPANRGVAATRNRGVELARGELIAYLDDDDVWAPDHLAGLVGALDGHPEASLAYGDAEVERMAAAPTPGAWRIVARRTLTVPFSLEDLARDDFIVPGGMVHRKSLYERIGPFDESLFVSDDWDWLLRVAREAGAGAFVRWPRVVVTVRIFGEGSNLSADFGARRRAALAEIERRHGTPRLEPKTFWEVAETYARRAPGP